MFRFGLSVKGVAALVVALVAAGCQAAGDATPAPEPVSMTSIVVLVDFSNSFAPLNTSAQGALQALADALGQWSAGREKRRLALFWGVIGAGGEHAPRPCPDLTFVPVDIIPKALGHGEYSNAETFKAAISECVMHLVKRSGEQVERFTDIAGAFKFATEVAPPSTGDRLFIAMSDFVQALPAGTSAVKFNLSQARVLLLYGPDSTTLDNAKVIARVQGWKQSLESLDAQRVCTKPMAAVTPAGFNECLF